jgi:flagellar protein FlbD
MIRVTRLNHSPIVINSELIERVEITPDTVITLTTGQIFRVRETAEEVIDRVVDFRKRITGPSHDLRQATDPDCLDKKGAA